VAHLPCRFLLYLNDWGFGMSMLETFREQRDAADLTLRGLLSGEASEDSFAAVEARESEIADLDVKIAKLEASEARSAVIVEARAEVKVPAFSGAKVGAEPMTYSEHGERSFVRDMINAQLRNDQGAWSNIRRHMDEVRVEARTTNGIDRVDGTGGEMVPPLWLTDLYSKALRPGRVTADLVSKLALPAGTDSINIPKITTGSLTGVQATDNGATSQRDMVTSSVAAPVRTISGYEGVAIQLVEQSPLAGGLDRMIFSDLMADYDFQLNAQVLQGVGTAGELAGLINTVGIGTVTYTSGTPTPAGIGTAVAQAISAVAKNRYKGAEAIVMHPSIWYSLVGAADSNGRPLVVPTANGPWNASGIVTAPGEAQGAVGTFVGLPVYLDPGIATVSSQLPIVIAAFSDTVLFESGVRTRVLNDAGSSTLTVRFQVYGYAAMAARYPSGIAKVTGTGVVPISGY